MFKNFAWGKCCLYRCQLSPPDRFKAKPGAPRISIYRHFEPKVPKYFA